MTNPIRLILILCVVTLWGCASQKDNQKKDASAKPAAAEAKATSSASSAKAEGGKKASCQKAKDARVLESVATASGGCELKYTKFGESKAIASAVRGFSYCDHVVDRMKASLQKAGFTCE